MVLCVKRSSLHVLIWHSVDEILGWRMPWWASYWIWFPLGLVYSLDVLFGGFSYQWISIVYAYARVGMLTCFPHACRLAYVREATTYFSVWAWWLHRSMSSLSGRHTIVAMDARGTRTRPTTPCLIPKGTRIIAMYTSCPDSCQWGCSTMRTRRFAAGVGAIPRQDGPWSPWLDLKVC